MYTCHRRTGCVEPSPIAGVGGRALADPKASQSTLSEHQEGQHNKSSLSRPEIREHSSHLLDPFFRQSTPPKKRQQNRQHTRAKARPQRPSQKHKTPKIHMDLWGLVFLVIPWNHVQWAEPDLNRRPWHFQCHALPTELSARTVPAQPLTLPSGSVG